MANFFQRFFSGTRKSDKFPRISWGHRLEGIEYETETSSLYIDSTFVKGRRIFTDSIENWRNNQPISQSDKATIFGEIIRFATRKAKEKPIVVINIDNDRPFWEKLCEENAAFIKEVQYESDKQKEDFQFNYFLDSIRKNGILVFADQTIETEAEFVEYWKKRKSK